MSNIMLELVLSLELLIKNNKELATLGILHKKHNLARTPTIFSSTWESNKQRKLSAQMQPQIPRRYPYIRMNTLTNLIYIYI